MPEIDSEKFRKRPKIWTETRAAAKTEFAIQYKKDHRLQINILGIIHNYMIYEEPRK
jgi:hypothetical protein